MNTTGEVPYKKIKWNCVIDGWLCEYTHIPVHELSVNVICLRPEYLPTLGEREALLRQVRSTPNGNLASASFLSPHRQTQLPHSSFRIQVLCSTAADTWVWPQVSATVPQLPTERLVANRI
jgi:hypothetical protein